MPQIPLVYGPMDLESDQSSRKDAVLAHLYNGFRVGQSIHMWPELAEHCDLGTGKPVYNWYSVLHGEHLAVSDGKLYRIANGTATLLTGTALDATAPPAFAEDASRIFIAANSQIHFYTPGDARVYRPRAEETDPVVSNTLSVTTLGQGLSFYGVGITSTSTTGGVIHYSTTDVNGGHYRLYKIVNGVTTEVAADEAPGADKSITLSGLARGAYTVRLKMVSLADASTVILSDELTLSVQPDVVSIIGGVFVVTEHSNNAPYFTAQPTVVVNDATSATISYGTADDEDNHYQAALSLDNGATWTVIADDETPGADKSYALNTLTPATSYRAFLRLTATAGNATQITSGRLMITTPSAAETPAAGDSPLVFSRQPELTATADTSISLRYSTADTDGNHYKVEYSLNSGATWAEAREIEKPGTDKTVDIDGLDADTSYIVRLRLTSRPSQCPVNVNSLAFLSGFLVADGQDPNGGGLPGDFGYSDTQGDDGPSYDVWSYENNASKPDALQRIVSTNDNSLFAIGTESVDVSYISGDVNNPFASNKGAAQSFGTPAKYSIAYDSQSIYFLAVIAGNRQIVRLVGGREPQIIGFPVGVPIQQIEDVTGAKAFLMGFRGTPFYIITFPTANISIDDSYHKSLTLAFNIRAEEWYLLGEWDAEQARYDAHTAISFAFDQTTRYIGGSDGKVYTLNDTAPDCRTLTHRWRNDGDLEWREGRVVSLGAIGDRHLPVKQRQCGRYVKRQDEFIFASENTRMTIRTGWRNWGKNARKVCREYLYDLKRGDAGVVFNGCEEIVEVVE